MFGRKTWWLGGVALLVLMTSCGADEPRSAPVSRAEAERELARVVAFASEATPEEFCAAPGVAEGNCLIQVEVAGPAPASAPPRVLGARDDPGLQSRNLILTVCGNRTDGTVYVTDFMVIRVEGQLEVPGPVYWSGTKMSIGTPGELTAAPEPTPATPPSCP